MNDTNLYKRLLKTVVLLFFIAASTPASAQEKQVNITAKEISIKEVFALIEQQTDYSIAYGRSKPDLEKKISLALVKADIHTAMKQVLKDTGHTYRINGYHIIIFPVGESADLPSTPVNEQHKPTQTIRGMVVDARLGTPVEFATVQLENTQTGSTTDSLGRFRINYVPVGRYSVKVSCVGYNNYLMPEVAVSSAKEVNLEIKLTETTQQLGEVVIRPEVNKRNTVNPMAITGGRMISMEEAGRFANGFDDPARLVGAFAGVASEPGTNAVAIRGNSPAFTQWRLEGIEIPNPTHFADYTGLGGGILSALSNNVMGNSDFFNGAFPAEYNNALSGVFDMHIRNGNNLNHEHSAQLSIMGIDLASEGPISRKHGSSYIANLRVSTTSLASGKQLNMKYQDLSFKLNFPTRRAGTFSIWGLGLIDKLPVEHEKDMAKWETLADRQSANFNMQKFTGAATHHINLNRNMFLKSTLAATYSSSDVTVDQHVSQQSFVPVANMQNDKWDIVLNSYLNTRISDRHVNRSGITATGLLYDLDYRISPDLGNNRPAKLISKGEGESVALSAYSNSVIDLTDVLTANVGLTAQYFTLNKNWSIEPRLSMKWQMQPLHSLAVSYGLHSRRESIDYYFVEKQINGKTVSNRNLDFAKAHHLGLSYAWNISPRLQFRVEPYFQYLYDMPVEPGTSFATVNVLSPEMDKLLVNKGRGRNYGIDLTLEQYMNKGFYYIASASVFKSKYKGGDGIWRSTRQDRGFIVSALAGKEWMVGKRKQHVLGINGRIFVHGGDRYTPVDMEKSMELKDIYYDESQTLSKQYKPAINGDISLSYKINKRRLSHEFFVKVLNVGMYTGTHGYMYNEKKNIIEREDGSGIIINIGYKIQF